MDYTKCITSDGKNYAAIEKIIAELSRRDYISRCKKLTKSQKKNIMFGKKKLSDYGRYTLSTKTLEALEIKKQYLSDEITEEEYKAYCLRQNLLNI